jgi:hypothetical protein
MEADYPIQLNVPTKMGAKSPINFLTEQSSTKTQLFPTNYKCVPNGCQRLGAVLCATKNMEEI